METGLGGRINLRKDGAGAAPSDTAACPEHQLAGSMGLSTSPKGLDCQGHSGHRLFIHSPNMCKGPSEFWALGIRPT